MQREGSVEELIFTLKDRVTVIVADKVEKLFRELQRGNKFKVESGGILVGILVRKGTIQITDVTEPQVGDVRQKFRFSRRRKSHQALMDLIWESSDYRKMYLGEWHTHDEPCPTPSWIDSTGWKRIARRQNNSPWMLFVIIGSDNIRMWTVDRGEIEELVMDEKWIA